MYRKPWKRAFRRVRFRNKTNARGRSKVCRARISNANTGRTDEPKDCGIPKELPARYAPDRERESWAQQSSRFRHPTPDHDERDVDVDGDRGRGRGDVHGHRDRGGVGPPVHGPRAQTADGGQGVGETADGGGQTGETGGPLQPDPRTPHGCGEAVAAPGPVPGDRRPVGQVAVAAGEGQERAPGPVVGQRGAHAVPFAQCGRGAGCRGPEAGHVQTAAGQAGPRPRVRGHANALPRPATDGPAATESQVRIRSRRGYRTGCPVLRRVVRAGWATKCL